MWRSQETNLGQKVNVKFSRQAHNAKVTDCHALFRILRFFELGCFLGRNIDLGGSFPTHDLKFGQFCDSTKKFWPSKNFVGIFQKFLDFFLAILKKKIIFRGRFSRKILLNDYDFWQFSTHPWYMRVCGKIAKLKKN